MQRMLFTTPALVLLFPAAISAYSIVPVDDAVASTACAPMTVYYNQSSDLAQAINFIAPNYTICSATGTTTSPGSATSTAPAGSPCATIITNGGLDTNINGWSLDTWGISGTQLVWAQVAGYGGATCNPASIASNGFGFVSTPFPSSYPEDSSGVVSDKWMLSFWYYVTVVGPVASNGPCGQVNYQIDDVGNQINIVFDQWTQVVYPYPAYGGNPTKNLIRIGFGWNCETHQTYIRDVQAYPSDGSPCNWKTGYSVSADAIGL